MSKNNLAAQINEKLNESYIAGYKRGLEQAMRLFVMTFTISANENEKIGKKRIKPILYMAGKIISDDFVNGPEHTEIILKRRFEQIVGQSIDEFIGFK